MQPSRKSHYIAYVRVSSSEQAQRNLSIPSQIDQIERYIKEHDYSLTKLFKESHSAFQGKRPVFAEMIEYLKKHKDVVGVIIFKWDRVSRNSEDFLTLESLTRKRGINVISVTEPNLNSYLGRYMVRDMQNRAILYSEELSFRVKLGIRKKLQNGGYTGGAAPYGYRIVDKRFVEDEKNGPILKFIFQTYVTGQYGYVELSKLVKEKFSLKRMFTKKNVELILKNTLYYGYRTKIRKLNNEEYVLWGAESAGEYTEVYKLKFVEPLISKELFDRCQHIKSVKSRHKLAYEDVRQTVRPKIFQCVCGRNMVRDDKKNIKYLKCTKTLSVNFPDKCGAGYSNLMKVFDVLVPTLKKIFLEESLRDKMASYVDEQLTQGTHSREKRLIEIDSELHKYKLKIEEITHSYIENILSKEIFETSTATIQQRMTALEEEKRGLDNYEGWVFAGKKVLQFLDLLGFLGKKLENSLKQKGCSNGIALLFATHSNTQLDRGNVLSYALKSPFNILDLTQFSEWQGVRELNP